MMHSLQEAELVTMETALQVTDWYSRDNMWPDSRTCNTFSKQMCTEPAGGSMYVNDNMTANDACCVCDGGITFAVDPIELTDAPTDAPTDLSTYTYKYTTETCEDLTLPDPELAISLLCTAGHPWRDSREPPFECIQYSYEDCVLLGNSYEKN